MRGNLNQTSAALASKREQDRRRNGVLAFLAAMVVLVVAAALMVPGISMTKGDLTAADVDASTAAAIEAQAEDEAAAEAEAKAEPEADEPEAAADDADDAAVDTQAEDEAAADDEAAEADEPDPADDGEAAVTDDEDESEADADEDATEAEEEAGEVKMPAKTFEQTVDLNGDKKSAADDLLVTVEAPKGALPEGTTMKVEVVKDKDTLKAASDEVEKQLDNKVQTVKAVDITFEKDGKAIEPAKDVHVSMRYPEVEFTQPESIEVVHVDADGNASIVEQAAEHTEKDEVTFESDSFSVYALVLSTQYISDADEAYEVTVSYNADAQIPEGSTLRVTEFAEDSDDYTRARNAVLADKLAKGEYIDVNDLGLAALDISIIDPDGNEIEPAAEVKVDMKVNSLPGVEDLDDVMASMEVQHHVEAAGDKVVVETVAGGEAEASFKQATNEEVLEANKDAAVDPGSFKEEDLKALAQEQADEKAAETSFGAEVFSTFTITWRSGGRTVTVHYVDESGNELDVSNSGADVFGNLNANSSSPAFLIYDIDGYEYSYTYRNTNNNNNRIAPLLTKNGQNRWQYMGANSTSTTELSNNDNIYVVYKKKADVTAGGTPKIDTDETWPDQEDPARKPQFTKSSTNNGNGTNNISLTITGPEKPVEKSTPADVIVIFDISRSMVDNNLGNITRLQAAKNATNAMANTLLNGQNNDVRMALITFSTTAQQANITGATNGFTSNYNNFAAAVNGLSADGGTNWEQALQLANQMQVREDAATFVVFVTDGDPTFRVSRGNVANGGTGGLSGETYNSNTTYQYYRNNHVFGQGNNDSQSRNFNFAVEQVKAIAGANKNFYAIGISNSVTKVQNLTTQGGVDASHAFIASDNAAMEAAFKSITESIKSILGFGNVEVTDGITALTNAEMKVMQTVDPNSFTYYRIVDGVKTEWTTREADGCAAATYNESKGAVEWNMGETFQLEDGVTYVVEFTVWPSQAAYDLVADLNNGLKTYASLTDAEKAQVVEVTAPTETTTGTYALKTNTDEVEATYNRTTKTGDTVTVSDTTDVKAEYHEGTLQNMALDSDYITVKKEWHNALDDRVVSGITLSVTKDGAVYLDDLTLNAGNSWTSDEQYISAGFITKTSDGRYNVREIGHDYTVTEPESFSYYWDLTADTYRPMVINGTLNLLIKTDSPTGTEGTDYFVIEGNTYQVSSTTTPELTASNDRRSNLNLKKLVTAETDAVDNVPNPDDTFTYTITVTDVNGDAVWFSAQDEGGTTVFIESYSSNVTPEVRDDQPTGSYSVPSGAEFTISIKAGWNVRFFNLPTGTTYSIQETGMVDGYEFVKAETDAEVTDPAYADDYKATPGTVTGNTVTGTIDQPNNVYTTDYTNNWNPNNEIVIIKTDENEAKLAGAQFKLSKMNADGEWQQIATFTSKADAGETLKVGHGLYKLEETAAPTDYMKTDTVYFKVETNGNTTKVTLTNEDGEELDDASTVYPDATVSGNAVSIKDWPLTTANAKKAWENADGSTTAPTGASVVYTLYADGTATDYKVTLDGTADEEPAGTAGYESEGWKAEFVNLPKYKAGTTTEIVYTVAETTTYPGYTASTTDPVASGETITNTQEATTANALKAWENADGSTTAPENASVAYTLYADGTATSYTVTLDGTADAVPTGTAGYESEAWKATFVNLPKYQAGTTTEIEYTVAETTTYPGYTASTTDPVTSGETITNTQGSAENPYATKEWKNADGTTDAPEGATVKFTLYADGTATAYTVTLDGTADTEPTTTGGYESEAWKATFVKLPKYKTGTTTEIVYTIAETTTYPGYTASTTDPVASGSTITNSQDPTTANATKEWKNADGTTEAPQGGQVTYTLYADGTATDYTVTLDGTADTAPEVTGGYESEAWKATFVKLPKYKTGTTTEIVYTIAETTTYPGYTASTTEPVASGETITNTQEATKADALKAWKNIDGSTTAPEGASVVYTLYADGTATAHTVTLDGTAETAPEVTGGYESEAWKAEFVNLPKYQAGTTTEIVYTIAETTSYPGYTASTTNPVASGSTITNSQDPTTAVAFKEWKNAAGEVMATAPEGANVTFTLFIDGEKTNNTVTLDGTADTAPTGTAIAGYESAAWKAEFVNLPKYKVVDGEAVEIGYTIAETGKWPGFEPNTEQPVASGEIITNQQSTLWVGFKKTDMDGNALSGAEFTFNDGTAEQTVTSGEDGIMANSDDVSKFELAMRNDPYVLAEETAPAGYKQLTADVNVTVNSNGVTAKLGETETQYEVTGDGSEDNPYVVTITNSAGNELPMTGGPGTALFTIAGILLVAAAGAVFLMGRRPQRGGIR